MLSSVIITNWSDFLITSVTKVVYQLNTLVSVCLPGVTAVTAVPARGRVIPARVGVFFGDKAIFSFNHQAEKQNLVR